MKKVLVIVSCLVLVLSLSVLSVSAATDGYDFASTAKQVSVNGTVVGEGVVIITDGSLISSANLKWAISVVLDVADAKGVYIVAYVHTGDGNDPAITLEEGQILLGVHSATSDPAQSGEYQNVNGKLAAQALEAGDTVAFTGIDFETGTVSEGATIIAGGTGASVEESDPETESEPENESVPADDSVPEAESTPADTSAPADSSSDVSEGGNEGGGNAWIYIVCAIAAILIVAVVVVMVKKK